TKRPSFRRTASSTTSTMSDANVELLSDHDPAGSHPDRQHVRTNVRTIEKSVTDLGFKFSDVKILLGNHAHRDHQEGDALVKELTGAQAVVMAEDVPEPAGDQTRWQGPGFCTTARRSRSAAPRWSLG